MFELETPFWELVARGAYLFIGFMILFRVLPRRTGGKMGPMDLVFLLLITEAASHSLGEFSSLADGTVQIATFMGLNYLSNRLAYAFPAFRHIVEQSPLPIVKEGEVIPDNLRQEALTLNELFGHLRLEGVDDLAKVKLAQVESDGRLSVVQVDR